jgi:electron transfer flavoprotein alpha subunit
MKTAIVLFADTASLLKRTAEINLLLSDIAPLLKNVELWFFYHEKKPEHFPNISCSLSCIRLIRVEHPYLPESFLLLLEQMACENLPDLLLFASDGLGAELTTRIAYRLNGSSCLQVETARINHKRLEITKPAYNNNMIAKFTLDCIPYCLSAAKTPCKPTHYIKKELPIFEQSEMNQLKPDWVKSFATIPDIVETEFENAKIVLAVGAGVKNKNNMKRLKSVAKTMGAQIGASRPVVMNAWAEMNRLIGASGKILSPSLCIAAGISGTGVFCVGIRNSEFIVAINTDRQADIFQIADIGIVDDLMTILTELEDLINTQEAAEELLEKKNEPPHSTM